MSRVDRPSSPRESSDRNESSGSQRLTRRRFLHVGGLAGGLALAGCTTRGEGVDFGRDRPWDALSLDAQLARVRAHTRQYTDVGVAEAAGFAEVRLAEVCTAAFYRQEGWERARAVDPVRPTGLVYAAEGPSRRLVAVAYLLPIRTRKRGSPPDLFDDEPVRDGPLVDGYSEAFIWEAIPDETGVYDGLVWRLLAWVHEPNPMGVFNSYNPNYPQSLGDTHCAD
jgi:hypothetical protein